MKYGETRLSQPIETYMKEFKQSDIDSLCEAAYEKMVRRISEEYAGKFLATLFKNPTMSKDVFDFAKA